MTPTTLEARVEDYLDGYMSPRERRAFEAELLEPEVQQALTEALALRTLLAELPPDAPPEGLIARIEEAMGVAEGRRSRREAIERASRFPSLGAALARAGWIVRGPARAVSGGGAEGLRTMGYAAAPLSVARASRPPKPPLWRRLLKRSLKR